MLGKNFFRGVPIFSHPKAITNMKNNLHLGQDIMDLHMFSLGTLVLERPY